MRYLLIAICFANEQPSLAYNPGLSNYAHTLRDTAKRRKNPKTNKNTAHMGLTEADRKNYILEIPDQKISAPHDTVEWIGPRSTFTRIAVNLSNKSNDTLKYYIMLCSWRDIYHTDNKDLTVMQQACDKNFPIVRVLAPHQTSTVYLPIIFLRKPVKGIYPYRIAMYLQKVVDYKSERIFGERYTENYNQNMADYMIWSAPAKMTIR